MSKWSLLVTVRGDRYFSRAAIALSSLFRACGHKKVSFWNLGAVCKIDPVGLFDINHLLIFGVGLSGNQNFVFSHRIALSSIHFLEHFSENPLVVGVTVGFSNQPGNAIAILNQWKWCVWVGFCTGFSGHLNTR